MAKTPASVWSNPVHFLAFGFGSGAAPVAPGTFGTLAAVPLWWGLSHLSTDAYLLVLFVAFIVGVWLCHVTSDDIGVHDHGGIVWDEFVGLWIALFAVPAEWIWVLIGFLLFRLFDIWKPWPIAWVDKRVAGGMGIMLDDVIAGVYALIVIQLLLVVFS
ncbi:MULTISPECIES: phosphatidylglycerophosphatase A family protein [Nitrincola]|uniref:Phosphatidylglycerophosphatase A n=1 Tax=Nitrincola nitratireducens TaxID=1229521 RepID=W9UTG7_9GAMM|nr:MULTISPECIES: phosphatidylglycerophosphatase A [Nitrincola]EXJ10369.1 Phosphatidylglycerophosphatase A [Nitrincola nitratireducens]